MSISLDTPTSAAGSWDRFRVLLDEHRADCVRQREEALAECAQSVPDPVAQRRSTDLQVTIEEIDAALAPNAFGTFLRSPGFQTELPEERLELRPFAGTCVSCTGAR